MSHYPSGSTQISHKLTIIRFSAGTRKKFIVSDYMNPCETMTMSHCKVMFEKANSYFIYYFGGYFRPFSLFIPSQKLWFIYNLFFCTCLKVPTCVLNSFIFITYFITSPYIFMHFTQILNIEYYFNKTQV